MTTTAFLSEWASQGFNEPEGHACNLCPADHRLTCPRLAARAVLLDLRAAEAEIARLRAERETPDWNAIGARLTDTDRRFCGAMEEAFRLMAVGVDRSAPDNPTAVRPESEMADALGELADICAQLAAPIVVTR